MWWKEAVIYHVYPRSFADGDGDGIGDLAGLRARLDHLRWLGVDGVWLSPIFRSPMADFGYDVADHCDVDPTFGTLADAEALVREAHDAGLRVLFDVVANHTSIEHPWFRDHPERYVWRDGRGPGGDEPPNNWVRAFPFPPALPAWTRDEATRRWYLHLFLPEQPDLDWEHPDVAAGIHDVLRFWLDRGVDGFRFDVVHLIGKDPALPDDPAEVAGIPHCVLHDDPRARHHIAGIRRVLDGYPGDRVSLGEIVSIAPDRVERTADHTGPGLLHLAFEFSGLHRPWGDADRWRDGIARVQAAFDDARGRWPTWALGNHDQPRLRTRWGGRPGDGDDVARAAAVLQLGLRGTPVVYAGDELGLLDAAVPPERVVDPGGRDGCRAPLPWTPEPGHGWPADPWLPFPPEAAERSVAAQREDPSSILWLYRRLLAARRASPALRAGDQRLLDLADGVDGVVAWERRAGSDRRRVVVSMGTEAVPLEPGWVVEVASHPAATPEGAPASSLPPGAAVWLRPA